MMHLNSDIIRLYYQGESFENTMSLHELQKVLEGLKEMMQAIYGTDGYEVFVHEILHGSCDIKSIFKDYGLQTAAGLTSGLLLLSLQAILFTQGKPFTYEVSGDNNTVVINNFQGESKNFEEGLHLPRILESTKFRTAGQKLSSPLAEKQDKLRFGNEDDFENAISINSQNCMAFKEKNNSVASEIIRGRMYEINVDAQTFKVDIPTQDRKFTVYLATNSIKTIQDFIPYVGTSDLNLIGIAERNMENIITKFSVFDFEITQNQFFPEQSSGSGSHITPSL